MPSLGEDLSDLRKKENLTLKNIFDSTRIPIYILKAIEDSSIFKDPKRNKTYVRSFVRTYAKALKISESDILKALDQTYNNKYDGLIAKNYKLSKPDSEIIDEDTSDSSQEYRPKFSLETPSESPEEEEHNEPPEETDDQDEKNELYKANTIKTSTGSDKEYTHPDSSKPHNQKMPEPPNVHNVNWAAMNNKITNLKTRTPVAIIAAIIVIILAAAAFFIYTRYETPGGSQNKSGKLQSVLPMDTLNNVKSVTSDSANAGTGVDTTTAMTLPDTLHLVVYAVNKKLEPVRIKSDLGNHLNPYWIEKGQAMRFRFLNNIYIRGQYSRMMLLFHGHPIPNFQQYKQNDGTIHLQRSLFESHKDWWKPSDGGPLPNGVPWPSVIHDSPVY